MSLVVIILVALFFVSGADAASMVMGMLSSRGNLHPRRWTLIVWGTFTGAAAAICLLAGADRKSTRLNSSHANISYAVFCLKKKKIYISQIWNVTIETSTNRYKPHYQASNHRLH